MNSLLYSIIVAALLSSTSLFAVLLRVSPLTAPVQGLSAFFASLFLSVSCIFILLFYALWQWFPLHAWDDGKILTVSVRQGIFVGTSICTILAFSLLGIVTWWIAVLVVLVFVLIEAALQY